MPCLSRRRIQLSRAAGGPGDPAERRRRPSHHAERREDVIELLGAASAALATVDSAGPDGPGQPLRLPGELVAYSAGLLADPEAFTEARRLAACHAYTAPALMTLLNAARKRHGVLAPAQFA